MVLHTSGTHVNNVKQGSVIQLSAPIKRFTVIPLHNQCIEHFFGTFLEIAIFGKYPKIMKNMLPQKLPDLQ